MTIQGRLVCSRCQQTYPLNASRWRCECGGPLDIEHQPRFDRRRIQRRAPTLWRYREALPIAPEAPPIHLGEGYTPLLQGRVAGFPVYLKQDHLFPTGSFKDRGAAVLVSHAASQGVQTVVEDSSGNAGASIAAYCARAGITCHVYVPEETSPAKIAQIVGYGAILHRIPGGRQSAAEAAQQAAQTSFYASHAWNPFFLHGTKTFAFEIWEQLGWRAPDTLVLPVGNGTLLLGAYIGFQELLTARQINRLPRLIAVQAAACAPLVEAHARGQETPQPITPQVTLAEGIAIAAPPRGEQILAAVRATQGTFIAVTESEIATAIKAWWRLGFAIEPTAAATLAGLARYLSEGRHDGEVLVSTITGHGLKAIDTISSLGG